VDTRPTARLCPRQARSLARGEFLDAPWQSVVTEAGARTVRIAFPEPIASKADARRALVSLLLRARAQLGR